MSIVDPRKCRQSRSRHLGRRCRMQIAVGVHMYATPYSSWCKVYSVKRQAQYEAQVHKERCHKFGKVEMDSTGNERWRAHSFLSTSSQSFLSWRSRLPSISYVGLASFGALGPWSRPYSFALAGASCLGSYQTEGLVALGVCGKMVMCSSGCHLYPPHQPLQ